MIESTKIQSALSRVRDQKSFIRDLLIETLGWPIEGDIEQIEDISFAWTAEEINAEGLDKKIADGQIWQIQRLEKDKEQPWGIFLLEFKNVDAFAKGRGLTGPLRRVLRGLVPKRRRQADRPAWDRENLLFICTHNYRHYRFAYFKPPKEKGQTAPLITFGWGPDIPCRTACEFNLPALEWPDREDTTEKWVKQWLAAFDKQKLTDEFFTDYKGVFERLEGDLKGQTKERLWAHDYSLQLLNRIMFLYFIQRKRWVNNDPMFLGNFWKAYKDTGQPKDTFFDKWLKVLFFEAFNGKFRGGYAHLPANINSALAVAPYLNGGLFKPNKLDGRDDFIISDAEFTEIFEFFEKYNFTVTEDTPLDQDVAVDPETIGKVYESLVNISEDEDRRGDAGIFYTPRVEIDMMCRLSVIDHLSNHLGDKQKDLLYDWVFAQDAQEKKRSDDNIASKKLFNPLLQLLENIKVVDPACGSGSFLVGMLAVLDDLRERLDRISGTTRSSYDRRKEIIGSNLYGVDVMEWACHVAELRLWLALIIDAQFTDAELHVREKPLLPNFSFNIRCGDSLVQEVAGVDMAHRRGAIELSQNLKRKLNELKSEKIRFYNNDQDRKYDNPDQIFAQEVLIFRELLEDRIQTADRQAKDLMRIQAQTQAHQQRNLLTGELEGPAKQFTLEQTRRENEIRELMQEKQSLEATVNTIRDKATVPFVWDIAFAEVMAGDKDGFDIVIGNPPYVRQENIADPRLTREEITTENKKEYKAKLARSVYKTYSAYFGYSRKAGLDKVAHKIDAKSDLYIYFYFHGLSLLNSRGSFCFITSNSWLDVGYGADLQEFLLKRCHVRLIIDNKAKRSFKAADVNTVISLFDPPQDSKTSDELSLEKTARFVMFKVPFEQVLSAEVFNQIEDSADKQQTSQYRVFPLKQAKLLDDGCEIPEQDEDEQPQKKKVKSPGVLIKVSHYIGNKWGGKYLRAPDIYWTILEKGKGKLVRLGDIAEVRFGIKTGANEFFYLDDDKIKQWGIEAEFLKPVIKSPRECKTILIDPKDLKYKIFMCHKTKAELKGTVTLEYIKWGEQQKFNERPSCAGRPKWWDLGERRHPPLICPSSVSDLFRVFRNTKVYADKRLYEIYPMNSTVWCHAAINSTVTTLFLELGSRTGLGEGLLDMTVYEVADCMIVGGGSEDKAISPIDHLSKRNRLNLKAEITNSDRQNLDSVIFDIIGLSKGEREAVYEAVIDLVESRLKKATSLED